MMITLSMFVSHTSADKRFARELVAGLRTRGANVWYDEHNLGHGVLLEEISRELSNRPIFIVVLSKAALASQWVRDECEWAYILYRRKVTHVILPVIASTLDDRDFNQVLFLEGFHRVEAPGHRPYPPEEATRQICSALAKTPVHQPARAHHPATEESVGSLLQQGKALCARRRFADAVLFLKRATDLVPSNADAWANLGWALDNERKHKEALSAYDRTLSIDPTQAWIWYNKSALFEELGNVVEALSAIEHLIALNPIDALAWRRKGELLARLGHTREAELALDRARSLPILNSRKSAQ